MPDHFIDVDKSEIQKLVVAHENYKSYLVKSPHSNLAGRKSITVKYYSSSAPESSVDLLQSLTQMVETPVETNGLLVCGFDTESGLDGSVELIQLAIGNVVILIRKCLFRADFLKAFFLNELFPTKRIVFSGAELALADALDMLVIGFKIVGLLDLTSVLSQNHGDTDFSRPHQLSFHLSDNDGYSLSLKRMYSQAFSIEWHKDKAVTCSDWGLAELSIVQLKYAALDAWTGAELGRFVLTTFSRLGIYKMIFGTTHADVSIEAEGVNLAKQLVKQTRELDSLSTKQPKPVIFTNIQCNERSPLTKIDIISSSYGNHVRNGSKIAIRVCSPGGSPAGIVISAHAAHVKGRKSTLLIDRDWKLSLREAPTDNEQDANQAAFLVRQSDICSVLVRLWTREFDATGAFALNATRSSSSHFDSVRLFVIPEPDKLLRQVRLSVSDFVRSHFVPRSFFPPQLSAEVQAEFVAFEAEMSSGRAVKTLYSLGWSILSGQPFDNAATVPLTVDQVASFEVHRESLNSSQAAALENAFKHRISVIKGPPGTGKTRTIASIVDVAQTGGRRALVVAPGNSASRRILEALVKTGFEDACLMVSEEYFYEWHEEAYEGESLGQFVHTKSVFVDSHRGERQFGDGSAASRAARDFRERKAAEHIGKWLLVAKGIDNAVASKPVVAIGTHGSISFNAVGESKKRSTTVSTEVWAEQVKNIVDIQNIDVLIVDETSQLWSGYGLSLLARLPSIKTIVLVGDEDQLPPYGVGDIPSLKSLFDAAITHQSIPNSVLSVTFRLPGPIAQLLSRLIYDNRLSFMRHAASDAEFLSKHQALLRRFPTSPSSLSLAAQAAFDARLLLQLLSQEQRPYGAFSSLLWVHDQSSAHQNRETKSLGNDNEAKVVAALVTPASVAVSPSQRRHEDSCANRLSGAERCHRVRAG